MQNYYILFFLLFVCSYLILIAYGDDFQLESTKSNEPEVEEKQEENVSKDPNESETTTENKTTENIDDTEISESSLSPEEIDALYQQIATLERDLEDEKRKSAEYLDLARRVQADFENYRKRVEKQIKDIKKYAIGDFALKILEISDNFERALNVDFKDSSIDEIRKGIELIYKQLQDTLSKEGIVAYGKEGDMFDPELHHAISVVEDEEKEDGIIISVYQRGYKYHDRILRPALVQVNRISKKEKKEEKEEKSEK